eukprot:728743_1
MPLVVLCGHPCAGKTTAAVRLKTYIENSMADETKESSQSSVSSSSLGKQDTQVVLVNEEALSIDRSCSFGDSTAERQTRGLLRAEAERHLSPRSIIILDSLNNIKGFRYELFTRAKASNTTLCVVYCDTSIETCRERNNARTSNKYPEEIFEDLVSRLEIPNSKNRWDSPLFTVKESEDIPLAAIADAVLHGNIKKASMSTIKAKPDSANSLHEADQTVRAIERTLLDAQRQGLAGGAIQVPDSRETLCLGRPVGLAELRRLRRQFFKTISLHELRGKEAIATAYVQFLSGQI